ncbi:MAG: hypothetical protein IT270_17165 [Saprospiraceae bacterium]|nr:hypothetical protein [Saprospiraceae bacterium]
MRKIDDQLKDAISRLPVKEKDKLLFRLVAKDDKLVRRLIFELLEGGQTRDARADELRELITKLMPESGDRTFAPGHLLLHLRHWNARIAEHVNATKDKSGEVILTCYLFALALRNHGDMIQRAPERRNESLAPYIVRRMNAIMKKAEKLHEDYHIEFMRDLNEVLEFIWKYRLTAAWARELAMKRRFEV